MTALATEARDDLVTTMETAFTGYAYTVHVITPAPDIPTPPAVVVTHGTPWLSPDTNAGWTLNLRLMVVSRYSAAHLPDHEQLVEDVLLAIPDGWSIGDVTAPAQLDTGAQGVVLASDIPVTATFATPAPAPAPPLAVPSAPGMPVASNWIETGGGWQYDLTWTLAADDGGSPILTHRVEQDGAITVVDGNIDTLGAQFSLTFPVEVSVSAVNAVGVGPASPIATITHP